jgi:hypothetical protein
MSFPVFVVGKGSPVFRLPIGEIEGVFTTLVCFQGCHGHNFPEFETGRRERSGVWILYIEIIQETPEADVMQIVSFRVCSAGIYGYFLT